MNEPSEQQPHTITGWRHTSTWLYCLVLLSSLVALAVSFMLAAETLFLARNPNTILSCDLNLKVSCSAVSNSWQAEIIKFGNLSFPNAFLGIAAESVFVMIGVLGLSRVVLPRWFALCTWLGSTFAFLYAYWLLTQSVFVIGALCPWCLLLVASTTIQYIALSHATVSVQRIGLSNTMLRAYYRIGYDLIVDVFWIGSVATLVIVNYLPYLI